MNAVIRTIVSAAVGVAIVVSLSSCASSRAPQLTTKRTPENVVDFGKATRNDRITYQMREHRNKDLIRKAEDLVESGILYYNAQNFSEAIEQFIPAEEILRKASIDNPKIKRKLEAAKSYLRKSTKRYSHELYLFAKQELASGQRSLDLRMLELAEKALIEARRLDPNMRGEINALLREVREAKEQIRTKISGPEHAYQTDSIFGPSVYPGAKYWGLILVYAYC